MRKKYLLFFVGSILVSTCTFAQSNFSECANLFAGNTPPKMRDLTGWKARSLCSDSFAILHSGATRTPLYVAERLNKAQLLDARDEKRSNQFYSDARLPLSERAQLEDYRHNGMSMDRGHLAPAGDMPNDRAMVQSFSLANIVPQNSVHNRQVWAQIEKATRKYVMRAQGDVYVITGVVFTAESGRIGGGRVRVPSFLYKLVYDSVSKRAWAHWTENSSSAKIGRPIEYDELVRRTGINFFPALDEIKN